MRTMANYKGLKSISLNPETSSLTCHFRTRDGQEFSAVLGDRVKLSEVMRWMSGTPSITAFPHLSDLERSWFDDDTTTE